jgi:hypothetical protein
MEIAQGKMGLFGVHAYAVNRPIIRHPVIRRFGV